jgi:hypothetical protein
MSNFVIYDVVACRELRADAEQLSFHLPKEAILQTTFPVYFTYILEWSILAHAIFL